MTNSVTLRDVVLTVDVTRKRWLAFVALTKPRIIELLLVTTVPTMILADRGWPGLTLIINTVLGGTLAAGGANAFNMYIDRDIDALMERTKGRPLVTGEVSPTEALVFASLIELVAFGWLWSTVNLLSAVLAVSACAFYVFVYTIWLKRNSTQNIVIGGAAGAVPVLIGWSSVQNTVGWEAIILFAVIFFWTPPHFWALAIRYEDDYSTAAVPMMPVVEGHQRTTRQMVAYSLVVAILSIALWPVGDMGWIYGIVSVVVSIAFVAKAVKLTLEPDPEVQSSMAISYFQFSITHLTILFAAVAADQLVL